MIREKPPQPPEPVGTKLITISGKEVVPPRQGIYCFSFIQIRSQE